MERIGLHNYEAFFLDYLEGNLNAQEEFELLDFLDRHPDLKAELDLDLDEVSLVPASAEQMDKSALKRTGIQTDEVDDLMIASVEGLLTDEQEKELAVYVNSNQLGKTFAYYRNTLLIPAATDVYGDTSDLKKKSAVVIPLFFRVAAAAAIILLFISIYRFGPNEVPVSTSEEGFEAGFAMTPKNALPRIDLTEHEDFEQPGSDLQNNVYRNDLVEMPPNDIIDTVPNRRIVPIDSFQDIEIVRQDSAEKSVRDIEIIEDDIAFNEMQEDEIISEEPIKVITNLAEGLFKKDVSYSRDKKKNSTDYVAHHFKLGRFEFERKK